MSSTTTSTTATYSASGSTVTQYGFFFDQSRCVHCSTCAVACKEWNLLSPGPAKWLRDLRVGLWNFPKHPSKHAICSMLSLRKSSVCHCRKRRNVQGTHIWCGPDRSNVCKQLQPQSSSCCLPIRCHSIRLGLANSKRIKVHDVHRQIGTGLETSMRHVMSQ